MQLYFLFPFETKVSTNIESERDEAIALDISIQKYGINPFTELLNTMTFVSFITKTSYSGQGEEDLPNDAIESKKWGS